MSRRTFRQGTLEIVAGWDRRSQHYFLDMYDESRPGTDQDTSMYCSMNERPCVVEEFSLEQILTVLRHFEIEPPDGWVDALDDDAVRNVGDVEMSYLKVTEKEPPNATP